MRFIALNLKPNFDHAFPQLEKTRIAIDELAAAGTIRNEEDYRHQFPDGRIRTNPGFASVEAGMVILKATVEDSPEDCKSFLLKDRKLSLSGYAVTHHLPGCARSWHKDHFRWQVDADHQEIDVFQFHSLEFG